MSRLVLLAAATVLGGGLVAALILHDPEPETGTPPAYAVTPPPSAAVLARTGVLPTAGHTSTHAPPGAVGVATAPVSVRYTFDGGADRPVTADGGGHELRPLAQNGGALTLVRRDAGLAVAFPQRCTLRAEKQCPRAILEGPRDDDLNPGTRPLRYGASVRMTGADLADGANVVQKGYSVGGTTQFKLQVDHLEGRPSCVITGRRIHRAEAGVDIADGRWHDLACSRTPTALTLTVDGTERASVPVPAGLSIANGEPLRIGGKGPNRGNDQFSGQIDDVFLTVS